MVMIHEFLKDGSNAGRSILMFMVVLMVSLVVEGRCF